MSVSVPLLKTLLPALLPDLAQWFHDQESDLLARGRRLGPDERADAAAARVSSPDRIRLAVVDSLPRTPSGILSTANRALEFIHDETCAFAFGYGIALRSDSVGDRALLARMYARVAQFEHFGGIAPFLHAFVIQRIDYGNGGAPLDRAAARISSGVPAKRWSREARVDAFPGVPA